MESALRDLAPAGLKVIETFRHQHDLGFVRLDRHLARCAGTCARLAIPFDQDAARRLVRGLERPPLARIRMTVDLAGDIQAVAQPLTSAAEGKAWRLGVAPARLDPADPWLGVKTTERALYERARDELLLGVDEILFANTRDEVCEGTITSLFADFGEGLVTPPLSCGLLPGVLRQELIETGEVREEIIPLDALPEAKRLFLGNSLRGLIPATLDA